MTVAVDRKPLEAMSERELVQVVSEAMRSFDLGLLAEACAELAGRKKDVAA